MSRDKKRAPADRARRVANNPEPKPADRPRRVANNPEPKPADRPRRVANNPEPKPTDRPRRLANNPEPKPTDRPRRVADNPDPEPEPKRRERAGRSALVDLAIILGAFVAATLVAEAAGAANLGTALSFGQIAFALAAVYVFVLR